MYQQQDNEGKNRNNTQYISFAKQNDFRNSVNFYAIVNVGLVLFIGVFRSVGKEYSKNNEQSHCCKNTDSHH